MAPKKASAYQNRKRKLEQQLLQVEKCPKISSFFESNTNVQNPKVIFESELEDNSNEISNCTNSSSNDKECSK